MRINLECHKTGCIQRRWLDDRHVVRRPDCRAGKVASGARAGVRDSLKDAGANWFKQSRFVERLQQPKSITSAYKDCLRAADGGHRIRLLVKGFELVTYLAK